MKYVLFVFAVLISLFFATPIHAQEITDPNLPVVRCASVSCTDPLYFFAHRMYMPMIGGNQ
jgi:hypothetical protein